MKGCMSAYHIWDAPLKNGVVNLHTRMYPGTSLSDHVRSLDSPLGDCILSIICYERLYVVTERDDACKCLMCVLAQQQE